MDRGKRFDEAVKHVVALKIKAIDEFVEEFIDPIGDVGSPEKIIGKPYEEWNEFDLQQAVSIYGQVEPNPLSNLIFRKKFAEVKELEAEVNGRAR